MVLLILIFKITWLLNNMNKLQSMWYFGKSEVNSFHRKRRNHYFLRIKGLSTQGHRIDIVRVGAWEDYSGHLGCDTFLIKQDLGIWHPRAPFWFGSVLVQS